MDQSLLFHSLPAEMISEIFHHCDLETKKTLRTICITWNLLVNHFLVIKPELNDTTFRTIRKCPLNIPQLTISKLQRNCISTKKHNTNWIKKVKKLFLKQDPFGISQDNLSKILYLCNQQLQLLHIESSTLKNVTNSTHLWNRNQFNNISHLRVLLHTHEPNHCLAINNLLSTKQFTNLHEFKICFADLKVGVYHWPIEIYTQLITTVYTFIAKHSSTLRNLWLYEAEELLSSETDFPIQIQLSNEHIQALSNLNLYKLRLFLGNFDDNHPIWPAICLSNGSNLLMLDVWGAPVPIEFLTTIQTNLANLRCLYWTSDHIVENDIENGFDITILKNATNLLHLDLSVNIIYNFESLPKQLRRLFWSCDLTNEQLIWISNNLLELVQFVIEENPDNNTRLPFINVLLLKQILKIETLELFKVYGNYDEKNISEFCWNTPGLEFHGKPDLNVTDWERVKDRVGFRVTIDRRLLHPIYLL